MSTNLKIGLIAGGILLAVLVVMPLFARISIGWEACRAEMFEHGMMGPWTMAGLGGWSMMGIIWLVIIGLIVWLVISVVRSNSHSATSSYARGDIEALEILKTRYARGEIDKAEYEEKLKGLRE
jgi:putative membrane protein